MVFMLTTGWRQDEVGERARPRQVRGTAAVCCDAHSERKAQRQQGDAEAPRRAGHTHTADSQKVGLIGAEYLLMELFLAVSANSFATLQGTVTSSL